MFVLHKIKKSFKGIFPKKIIGLGVVDGNLIFNLCFLSNAFIYIIF